MLLQLSLPQSAPSPVEAMTTEMVERQQTRANAAEMIRLLLKEAPPFAWRENTRSWGSSDGHLWLLQAELWISRGAEASESPSVWVIGRMSRCASLVRRGC